MNTKRQRIIRPYALTKALEQCLESYQILYISTPFGWGKTMAVKNHFRGKTTPERRGLEKNL